MTALVVVGNALEVLAGMADESVHCCITSPPYWGLRAYGGDAGMIGLEPTFAEHLESLLAVFREVRRVLRPDGTLWLNYGDSYAGSWGAQSRGDPSEVNGLSGGQAHAAPKGTHTGSLKRTPGRKPKDLMLMPTDVAGALRDDGWWLRSMIPQIKSNPMPESVKDRPTNAVEYWFLLTKAAKYFYDAEAVKEPVSGTANPRVAKHDSAAARKARANPDASHTPTAERNGMRSARAPGVTPKSAPAGSGIRQNESYQAAMVDQPATRNMRNWILAATAPFKGAHFATFAPHVIEPWIKAGTSEKGCCPACGAPWVRETGEKEPAAGRGSGNKERKFRKDYGGSPARKTHQGHSIPWDPASTPTMGWRPSCECDAGEPVPATVLDPFAGAGTVGLVAARYGRDSILIEINAEYAEMARARIRDDAPLLNEAAE